MIAIDDNKVSEFMYDVEKSFTSASLGTLFFNNFIYKTLASLNTKHTLPSIVYVCPPTQDLLRNLPYPKKICPNLDREIMESELGGFTQVIRCYKYPQLFSEVFWKGNSLDGVRILGSGYENGDSRHPSDVVFNDTNIHGFLGGTTGTGKSVTLMSIVESICAYYPPWEVKLVLIDPKIAEFKKLGVNSSIPHVSIIAATTDPDYVISALQDILDEMEMRNKVFSKYGNTGNIKDFRLYTGWCMEQIFVIIDEYTALLTIAERKSKEILRIVDLLVRMGRNSGIHMLITSQEVGDNLPAQTLNQITVRLALGCTDSTSLKILGNEEAMMYAGQKGRLIINTSPQAKSSEDNRHFRVPYVTPELTEQFSNLFHGMGKVIGFEHAYSFYDEDYIPNEKEFESLCKKYGNINKMYLGEPSFVMHEPDGENFVKIDLQGGDCENILVVSGMQLSNRRFLKMLDYNTNIPNIKHKVLSSDANFVKELKLCGNKSNLIYFKNVSDDVYHGTLSLPSGRRLLLEVDDAAFKNQICEGEALSVIEKFPRVLGGKTTKLYKSRYYYLWKLLHSEPYLSDFSLKSLPKEEQYQTFVEYCAAYLHEYEVYKCENARLTLDKFPVQYIWMINIDRTFGLGRDPDRRSIMALKRIMQDSSEMKIRFIVSLMELTELSDIINAFRYVIIDGLKSREKSLLKISDDDYPEYKSNNLGMLYIPQNQENKILKFKKMMLDGELIVK